MDVLVYVCLAPTGVGYAHLSVKCFDQYLLPLAQSLFPLARSLLPLGPVPALSGPAPAPPSPVPASPWPSPCSPGPAPVPPGPGERTANPSRKSSLLHGHETTWLSISLLSAPSGVAGLCGRESGGQRGHRRHQVLPLHFRLLQPVLPFRQPGDMGRD
jgi:hypothetical protein